MENSNLLTVDLEDWASSSLFLLSKNEAKVAKRYLLDKDPLVERGVQEILNLLAEKNHTATFFALGNTVKNHKTLIRKIHDLGHEIASHSMNHPILPELHPSALVQELRDSKKLLEDIIGNEISGFRAPNLSGIRDIPFFFQMLCDAGYRYDSSFTGDRYNPNTNIKKNIVEIPVTTVKHLFFKMPLGGTYLKIMTPNTVSRFISKENKEDRPAVIYIHPYELSGIPIGWPHPSPSVKARFSLLLRNLRNGHHLKILKNIFCRYHFVSVKKYLKQKQYF